MNVDILDDDDDMEVVEQIPIYPLIHLGDKEQNTLDFKSNVLTTYKYEWWNFLPKNLFEQFRKATNLYFLVMTVITFIPQISPIPGWTAAAPFAVVLLAGMLKEGWEDWKRHKADREINRGRNSIVSGGREPLTVLCQDIHVGDFVFLEANDIVPADMVIMAASDDDEGVVYIETAQLDGETNLKRRRPFSLTEHMAPEQLASLKGTVRCILPTEDLEEFSGSIQLAGEKGLPVDISNLIMRGTKVHNWCIGLVVYAGFDTKLALNSSTPPSKYSTLNKAIDRMVLGIVAVQFIACIVAGALAAAWQTQVGAYSASYLGFTENAALVGLKAFFSYLILTSYVVPQTLMISLEIAKICQGRWIDWDEDMMQRGTKIGARSRSTDQNDELARVKWICSDKTGTLTKNLMNMMHVVIDGEVYDNILDGSLRDKLERDGPNERISEFLYSLAVGHTVTIGDTSASMQETQVETAKTKWKKFMKKVKSKFAKTSDLEGGPVFEHGTGLQEVELDEVDNTLWAHLEYKGSSPDEEAFVKATKANGYVFTNRLRDDVTVTVDGDGEQIFQILHTLEFTSTRARMSVIVRHPNGTIVVYSKGADSKMLPRLISSTPMDVLEATEERIEELALTGLRTLIVTKKVLDADFYAQWAERLRVIETGEDNSPLEERKARTQSLYEEVEKELELLGVTAVEDKLQDDVSGTINFFLEAGIRVMMITGDKQGTAINIARSTRLFTSEMALVAVNAKTEDAVEAALFAAETTAAKSGRLAVVVDGQTLNFLLKRRYGFQERFYQLLYEAEAIVCCRTNPRQKAKIVGLIRDRDTSAITLAIGDGGNDVSMIQRAHIGVGLYGKEGTQAARSSDYALREFQHLKKLVAVHGRWNYVRNASMVQYWVYKNVSFIFITFWFGIHCAWSGQNFFDAWILTGYNVLFTSLPPLFFGIFEKDVSVQKIYQYPQLYKEVQNGIHFTPWTFSFWALEAFYVSLICYFLPYAAFATGGAILGQSGWASGMGWQGNLVSIIGIVVVNLRMMIETRELHWVQHLAYWICFGFLFLAFIYESFAMYFSPNQVGMIGALLGSGLCWMLFILVTVVCLLPVMVIKSFNAILRPTDAMIIHEEDVMERKTGHIRLE